MQEVGRVDELKEECSRILKIDPANSEVSGLLEKFTWMMKSICNNVFLTPNVYYTKYHTSLATLLLSINKSLACYIYINRSRNQSFDRNEDRSDGRWVVIREGKIIQSQV